ncbi:hypothetical protein [Streptomyces beihaiensis]|uniref:Uncharacterized protein n=1 Tax=Streptomyces beihaiensis TaxID=2984495 RepID=A0ABT3TU13_9ACTN|nr:hypothetical protein [Streptomyces beihaiensis]MCX3059575.1 hypothetical protein [Streptomyces beihaiensis]
MSARAAIRESLLIRYQDAPNPGLVARVIAMNARSEELREAADALNHGGFQMPADLLRQMAADPHACRTVDGSALVLPIFRASRESITFGLYLTAAPARAHCEAYVRREQPTASLDWIEDEEDGVAELVATIDGIEWMTGYVVRRLKVAAAYDEDGDE